MAIVIDEWYVGSELIYNVAVVDTDGAATNPSSATITLTDPDGGTTTAPAGSYVLGTDSEVTNPSTGTVRFIATTAFTSAMAGLWELRASVNNGTVDQVSVELFRVLDVR